MDIFLENYNDFEFYSIQPNSRWWNDIITFGYKCDNEFIPKLSERMPIEDYFFRFQNENGFTIVATKENDFVGCLCSFYKHPETNRPWYQCIIINEHYRQNKLAKKFYDLSDIILKSRGEYFVQGRTWVQNIKNRKALKSIGFYQTKTKIDDRGIGIHTLLYEKCLYKSNFFNSINKLGILGGMGANASAKFNNDICFLTSQTEKEQYQIPILLYSATYTPDRTELILANKQKELAEYLNKQIQNLLQFEISHIVICCFSYHAVLELINPELRKKIVSLIDYTSKLLNVKKGKYLSLGTNGSYNLKLLKNIENLIYPNTIDQENIHNLIYKLKIGEPKELILIEVENIISKYNCEGVVIACTDLYLISDDLENHFTELEIINPLKIITYDINDSWKENLKIKQSNKKLN